MKRTLLIAGVAVFLLALLTLSPAPDDIGIRDFRWTVEGKVLRYTLTLENRTDDQVDVEILLVAETKTEGRDRTTVLPRGSERLNASLRANETKEVSGQLTLNQDGDSHLVIQPYLTSRPTPAPAPASDKQRAVGESGRQ